MDDAVKRLNFSYLVRRNLLHVLMMTAVCILSSSFVRAQTVVISNFSGASRKTAANVKKILTDSMRNQGIRVLSFNQYLRRAKRHRIPQNKALWKTNIQKLARDMNLDGVLVGAVKSSQGQEQIELFLFDFSGRTVFNTTHPTRRRSLTRRTTHKVVRLLSGSLKRIAIAKASSRQNDEPRFTQRIPPRKPTPTPKPIPVANPEAPRVSQQQSTTPSQVIQTPNTLPPNSPNLPVTQNPTYSAQAPAAQPTQPVHQAIPAHNQTVAQNAALPPAANKWSGIGSVADISLAAGMSGNLRSGLEPIHKSGVIPGVWVSGRYFFGSLTNATFVKDIGLGGFFNMLVGLEYGPKDSGLTWTAKQMQWQAELMYRLAFNHLQVAPAFLIRLGLGDTTCKILTESALAISTQYKYPYGMLDIYMTLFPSLLRFYVTGGYKYLIEAKLTPGIDSETTESVDWSGSGLVVGAGVDFEILSGFDLKIGYELNRFMLHKGRQERSDTYQTFMLQLGWRFDSY